MIVCTVRSVRVERATRRCTTAFNPIAAYRTTTTCNLSMRAFTVSPKHLVRMVTKIRVQVTLKVIASQIETIDL